MDKKGMYVYTNTSLIPQILKILSVMSFVVLLVVIIGNDFDTSEIRFIYIISTLASSAVIFAVGEIVQILHDIRNKVLLDSKSSKKK